MKWRIVEERVWEVEAASREEALKVFKSESSPPTEVHVAAEDWWTQDRCEKLADVIRNSLNKRLGICKSFTGLLIGPRGPWVKKAHKSIKELLKVDLIEERVFFSEIPCENHEDYPSHQGRWDTKNLVGVWLFESYDKVGDEYNTVWSVNLPEDLALKILVLGGF